MSTTAWLHREFYEEDARVDALIEMLDAKNGEMWKGVTETTGVDVFTYMSEVSASLVDDFLVHEEHDWLHFDAELALRHDEGLYCSYSSRAAPPWAVMQRLHAKPGVDIKVALLTVPDKPSAEEAQHHLRFATAADAEEVVNFIRVLSRITAKPT